MCKFLSRCYFEFRCREIFITNSMKHSSLLKEHSAISTEKHWKAVISLFTNDSLYQTFNGGLCEGQSDVPKNDSYTANPPLYLRNFWTINESLINLEINAYILKVTFRYCVCWEGGTHATVEHENHRTITSYWFSFSIM